MFFPLKTKHHLILLEEAVGAENLMHGLHSKLYTLTSEHSSSLPLPGNHRKRAIYTQIYDILYVFAKVSRGGHMHQIKINCIQLLFLKMPRFAHIVVNLDAMILPELRSTYAAKTVAISFAQLLPTACSSSRSSLQTSLLGSEQTFSVKCPSEREMTWHQSLW